jgi:predicted MFS family arabinose efflux permease
MLDNAAGAPLDLFDLFGVFGAALYIGNYTLLVMQRSSTDRPVYFSVNLLAASLLLLSLTQSFNLGAALIQFFFLVMSVVGIISRVHPLRQLRRLRRAPVTIPQPIRWSRPGVDARKP